MRQLNILIIILLTMGFISCTEEFTSELKPEKPESLITSEHINSYDVLKSYIEETSNENLKLSAYTGANGFLEKSHLYSIVASNFNMITAYDVMGHGGVVQDDGTKDFSTVTSFLEEAAESGIEVFGYSLCWHEGLNTTYLNGKYAAMEFQIPAFPNILDKTGLEDGIFTGWVRNTAGGGKIELTTYNEQDAVKLTSGSNSANPEDLRLTTPGIPVSETTYEVTMFLFCNKVGEGRVTFEGLNNNAPELDWTGSGKASETFTTVIGWNKISFQISDFAEASFNMNIDLGYRPGINYFMNIEGLSVVDINSEYNNPDEIFLEAEDGIVGSKWTIVDDSDASGGKYVVVPDAGNSSLLAPDDDAANHVSHTFTVNTPGNYKFWIRGQGPSPDDDSYHFRIDDNAWIETWNSILNPGYNWHVVDTFNFTAGEHTVTVSWREDGTILDRLYFTLTDKTPTELGSPAPGTNKIILDIENDDKAEILGNVLNDWITSIVSVVKENVNAWNVVNEPMDDNNPHELLTAEGASEDAFYWQDYLGKDYAVMAFNTARANVKDGDLLFIGDYGLENNLEKCRGLIEYVEYIEDKGATVDGIEAQMHLSLQTNEDNISSMFQILAETGKLIKVSQLEVSIPDTVETTEEILNLQSEKYESAINRYFQIVPVAQRYGIEIVGLVDSEGNSNGLWNRDYNRKPAYAGVAEGLKEE